MDRQLIKALIDALERSSLSELEYARDGERLRLVKAGSAPGRSAEPVPVREAPPLAQALPSPASGGAVVSPLYGVVHLRPAPEAEPFVTVGAPVSAGQVLCTVEAMKVFTEIRTDRAGTVQAIPVESGQEVEPGQVLVQLA